MTAEASRPDLRSALGFQYAAVKRWAQVVHDKMAEEDWLARGEGFRNPPHWIFGHVAVSSDIAPGVIEAESLVPAKWRGLFDQGTKPDPQGKGYPSPAELVRLVERAMDRNLEVLNTVDPRELEKPPIGKLPEGLADFLKTRERLLSFSTLHLAYHLGQINMIYRALHPEAPGY